MEILEFAFTNSGIWVSNSWKGFATIYPALSSGVLFIIELKTSKTEFTKVLLKFLIFYQNREINSISIDQTAPFKIV
jgi:hypothetical protein